MIKLQDFARQNGVTDRAIQKHLKKYESELEGLFERRGSNGTWLSDEACRFLLGKMKTNPVVVLENENQAELERLRKRVEELEDRLERKDILIEKLQVRVEEKTCSIEELKQERLQIEAKLQEERERKLTWKERITGKKQS
jgi:predicted DNA binding protein